MKSKIHNKWSSHINKNTFNRDEKGIIFISAIALLAAITLAGTVTINSTTTDIKISSNYKKSKQAFYVAEAGTGYAKLVLATVPFNNVLNGTFGGTNEDGQGLLDFGQNVPFANGNFDVFVDDTDGLIDIDNIVRITSTGNIGNGSRSTIRIAILKSTITPPQFPAAITVLGEAETSIFGNGVTVDGRDWTLADDADSGPTGTDPDKYSIAVSNIGNGKGAVTQTPAQAIAALDADINATQAINFAGTSTSSYAERIGIDDNLTSEIVQGFVDIAKTMPDNYLMLSDVPPGGIAGSTSGMNNQLTVGIKTIELGTVSNPKVTYFNMKKDENGGTNPQVIFNGNIVGAGLLIIEGNDLIFDGGLSWDGIVIVIGDDVGGAMRGAANKEIRGTFIIDEQNTDPIEWLELVLNGNSNVRYSSEAITLALTALLNNGVGNITVLSWQQL